SAAMVEAASKGPASVRALLLVDGADHGQVVALPDDLAAAPLGQVLGARGQVDALLQRRHLWLGNDHVSDDDRPGLLAHPAKQVPLLLVVRWWTESTESTRSHGPSG